MIRTSMKANVINNQNVDPTRCSKKYGNNNQLLNEQNNLLMEQNKVIERLMAENDIFKEKLGICSKQSDKTQIELKEMTRKYEAVSEELQNANSALKKLQEKYDAAEKEKLEIRKAYEVKEKEIKLNTLEVRKLQTKLETLKSEGSINSTAKGQNILELQKNLLNSKITISNPGSLTSSRATSRAGSPTGTPSKGRSPIIDYGGDNVLSTKSTPTRLQSLSIHVSDEEDEQDENIPEL